MSQGFISTDNPMIITRTIVITITTLLCTAFSIRAGNDAFPPTPIRNQVATDTINEISFFPINSTRLAESPALSDLVLRLDSIRYFSPQVVVRGTSSPDGPESFNLALSRKRAKAVRDYIAGNTSLPDSAISVVAAGEDWQGLREGIERIFSRTDASRINAIIDSHTSADERERHLRRLGGGRIWRRMSAELFPLLRGVHIDALLSRATTPLQEADTCHLRTDPPVSGPASDSEASDAHLCVPPEVPYNTAEGIADHSDSPSLPSWYLKTNLPAWAMLWTNIAVEFDIHPRLSVQLPIYYSGLNYFTGKVKFRTLAIQPEARYWFGSGYTRKAFVGAHFGLGWYNVAFGGDTRYQDHDRRTPAIGGGIAGGYRFSFTSNPRWQMEASVGVGCYRLDYDHFENRHNGHVTGRTRRTFFGLDQVALSVSYSFGLSGKKGGDR